MKRVKDAVQLRNYPNIVPDTASLTRMQFITTKQWIYVN